MTILISIFIFIIVVSLLCWFLMQWTTKEINKDNFSDKSFFKYAPLSTVLYLVDGYVKKSYIRGRYFVIRDDVEEYYLSSFKNKRETPDVTYRVGEDLVKEKDIIMEVKEEI